jgi:DNA-binding MarR family transcriptional regulator
MLYDLYEIILENPGITRKEILKEVDLHPTNVSKYISRLVKKGKVVRVRERVPGNVTRYYPVEIAGKRR